MIYGDQQMTARDFCYWLQGIFEVHKVTTLDESQIEIIKNHLNLVFVHDIDTPDPTGKLQAAHDGKHGSGIKRC
jgi:hypothetical protein